MVVVLAAGREGSIAWAVVARLESRGFCLLLLGTFFLLGFFFFFFLLKHLSSFINHTC